ncbi:DUF6314 family protein [Carnimonas bestiolae]|uniref:DUF6314 family protein n=1 Tax=Carnimonas bestiolae TaxID=3402172 RepID=UPI003EDC342C
MTAIIRLGIEINSISQLEFSARTLSGSRTGWDGHGSGRVTVHSTLEEERRVVRLEEQGEFALQEQPPVPFTNRYRLTWYSDFIRLHHERRGQDNAVWLFDLIEDPSDSERLISRHPHPCGDDTYAARLVLTQPGFTLCWKIEGPRKNEFLEYHYR